MKTLISTAQDLTTSWADLGDPVKTGNCDYIGLWVNLDINDSNNARVRALGQLAKAGGSTDEWNFPIKVVSSSDVKVEDEYLEFNVDADQLVVIGFELDKIIPWVQFQVQVSATGATAGQIDAAYVTFDNFQ